MVDKKSIEQLFHDEFESFEFQPSEKVWKGVRSDLFIKNFLKFSPNKFNIWYATGIVVITSLAVLNINKPAKPISTASETIKSTKEIRKQEAPSNTEVTNSIATPEKSIELKTTKNSQVLSMGKTETIRNLTQKAYFEENTKTPETPAKTEEITNTPPAETNVYSPRETAMAWFTCYSKEGCAPLSVSFNNYSENATRYFWSFGDGGNSDQKNPSYIFDEPGTWFVSLTAYSANNEISIYTDSIKVNSVPEARFSMDNQGNESAEHPVYFYNYSLGATEYTWDFGDGTSSNAKEPDHYFSKKSAASITLIAVSEAGCADTIVLQDALKEGEPTFMFPTAFSPNTNGPGTGQYARKDPANDVFYPVVVDEPVEYQLRIFNRQGVLIFESNDISIGWDGYYKEELQQQGVYVWKARASFADGRSIVRMGDITLLWGE